MGPLSNHKDTCSYHSQQHNAETGVGPAIASGNQVYNGICADLPQAPMNKAKAAENPIHRSVAPVQPF
jgi:hypothetical protein